MLKIAIQGGKGSYSERAALDFDSRAQIVACRQYGDLFAAVKDGRADCMVIPIENTTAGSIYNYYDLLLKYTSECDFHIYEERSTIIRHCLIGRPGAVMSDVKTVKSHFAALMQCQRWLDERNIEATEAFDTAGATLNDNSEAKIASIQAAADDGVVPLATDIQDLGDHNITRFLLIRPGAPPVPQTEFAKASIAFCVKNQPGSLFRTLAAFGSRSNVNLVRIESRNLKGTASNWVAFAEKDWDLVYYADFTAPTVKIPSVLDHLREVVLEKDGTPALQVFGTFPIGDIRDLTGKTWR